jgi:hypothetical protein
VVIDETTDDIFDFFRSEGKKIRDKIKEKKDDHKHTLKQENNNSSKDDDFSNGEDDEGHPEDESKYDNHTGNHTFESDLKHIENDNS